MHSYYIILLKAIISKSICSDNKQKTFMTTSYIQEIKIFITGRNTSIKITECNNRRSSMNIYISDLCKDFMHKTKKFINWISGSFIWDSLKIIRINLCLLYLFQNLTTVDFNFLELKL